MRPNVAVVVLLITILIMYLIVTGGGKEQKFDTGEETLYVGLQAYWDIYGLLQITIDNEGNIEFVPGSGLRIPTPLGDIGAEVPVTVNPLNADKDILVIRVEGKGRAYDLEGKDFSLVIPSSDKITVSKRGNVLTIDIKDFASVGRPYSKLNCSASLASRFSPNKEGITVVDHLRLRDTPTSAVQIELEIGTRFITTGEPVCAHYEGRQDFAEILWWPVRLINGTGIGKSGWVAESRDGVYYIKRD